MCKGPFLCLLGSKLGRPLSSLRSALYQLGAVLLCCAGCWIAASLHRCVRDRSFRLHTCTFLFVWPTLALAGRLLLLVVGLQFCENPGTYAQLLKSARARLPVRRHLACVQTKRSPSRSPPKLGTVCSLFIHFTHLHRPKQSQTKAPLKKHLIQQTPHKHHGDSQLLLSRPHDDPA